MSKFLSLDWFKETAENAIAKVVANKLESLMEQEEEAPKKSDEKLLVRQCSLLVKLASCGAGRVAYQESSARFGSCHVSWL